MLKFLIFLAFLTSFSFFLADAYSIEVEIGKESDRIIESMGWTVPEKIAFQEQVQIVIDHTNSKNKITLAFLSNDPNDIRFPDYIEDITSEPKIISFMITNQFGCSLSNIDKACVIIDVERRGLGDNIPDIRKNTRAITDKIVGGGVILYAAEFESVTLKPKTNFDGKETFVARALYTVNKQPTSTMFNAISAMIFSSDIRTSGGFYDHAVELTKNNFSSFNLSMIPIENGALRAMHVSLSCSDVIPELVRCPTNVSEQIEKGEISPLDFIGSENLSRSNMFKDEFLPLNSIVHVTIFSENDLQVKNVNSNVIKKLEHIGNVQDNGWFFASQSGGKIDGRFLFGPESSISKTDLSFSIGDNTGEPIGTNDGGCLIATAAFGSEMAPQVQFLREIRDNTVLQTESGSSFIAGFNQFYYSFSPAVADYERENAVFKEAVKLTLTPLLASLTLLQYVDIDSESEMLAYGIGVILLNIGMYFVVPAAIIIKIKKRFN